MYSIISTLDPEADRLVRQLRARLINQNPAFHGTLLLEPHLSWLGVDDMDAHAIGEKLTQMAQTISPLYLQTTGFGIFTGENPVLYLPVIKTDELARLHSRLWDFFSSQASISNLVFRPEQWLPHITVFYLDKDDSVGLSCGLADLVKMDIDLNFSVDHFKIAYFKGEQYGQLSVHRFKG